MNNGQTGVVVNIEAVVNFTLKLQSALKVNWPCFFLH